MKKIQLRFSLLLAAMLCATFVFAQDWVSMMQDPKVNFFEVQKAFNKQNKAQLKEMEREQVRARKKGLVVTEEDDAIPGYSQYKRWEWFMAPRVSATGERPDPSFVWNEMNRYHSVYGTDGAGNWTFMGPSNTSAIAGAGRVNFCKVDPNNANHIFVGTPSGGLWESSNGGTSWTSNTDHIAQVIGCTDLAIDPGNSSIMYLATGDGEAGDTYTVGLLKTTDGGATWNPTGLSFYMANYRQMSKVLLSPVNSSIITVATSGGIYQSTDAGVTFTQRYAGSYKDLEYKPGDPTTMYACGTDFIKSTNSGSTWAVAGTGLAAATAVSRFAIAVTAADPARIYLISGLPAPNYGTEGFYLSTNSGTSFAKISTPNIGAQQWYDLAIAANPTTATEVLLGGQTQFLKSTNGGTAWAATGGVTHVDYHDLMYTNSTTAYVTSDGGVWRTTNNGSAWTNLSNNLAISQMYGFGQSTSNANLLIQGWQDNGTNIYNGSWGATMGGDGMLAFISKSNDNNMWGSQYSGSLNRSTNGGGSWAAATTGIAETGAWVTPWREDPVTSNTLWSGFLNVYKSTNGGTSWTRPGTFNTSAVSLAAIAVSPANNQVVWATNGASLWKSSNGGTAWTAINTTTLPPGNKTYIACSNTDANKAWVTFSGYNSTIKVYQTTDQGATWTNLNSQTLPNIPVNCITYVNGSNDGLYIGTDVGVYYKDATMSVWQPFYNGLPNVVVTQIEIYYAGNKIRASTYGRGMWETDPYVAGTYAPTANFGASKTIACPGAAVQFTDYSAGVPTSWSWSFPGGNPSSSTDQNPIVYYNTPGNYPVTLIATNGTGSDTKTYTSYISISSSPNTAPVTTGGSTSVCAGGVVNLSATSSVAGTFRWWDSPGGGTLLLSSAPNVMSSTYSPTVATTSTYYVDQDFPGTGVQDATGEFDNTIGAGASFTANDIRGLYFDVLEPIILNSVKVFSASAGNRTIEIIDANGNTYKDTTINIPAAPNGTVVTLNMPIYPGNNYFIKCRGNVDLYRNSAGAIYPYTSLAVNITNSNAGSPGYYYFFYDWQYTTFVCNTARTPVVATNTCSVGIDEILGANGTMSVYPNPNNGLFSLNFNTENTDDYNVKITNVLGEVVYEEHLANFSGQYSKAIDMSKKGKGMYMINLSNSKKVTVRKVMVY